MLNPINQQRLRAFKRLRRAYVSLWLLVGLYAWVWRPSWCATPTPTTSAMRAGPTSPFWPPTPPSDSIWASTPKIALCTTGCSPRPTTKAEQLPGFADKPDNYMLFPPARFGPNEIIPAESLPVSHDVTVSLTPQAQVGTVDLRADLRINRATNFTFFHACR